MEREKKEYRKNREWEKEKERERLAMERMAVERRRQEGDSRVIFHDCIFLTCLLFPYKLFFLCGTRTIISVGFQPNSEDVVRPRTREEYEYQRQKNYKPPRYTASPGEMSRR